MAEKPRNFRIGVMRKSTSEFKPVFNIATAGDGGLIVAPREVPEVAEWSYGIARAGAGGTIGVRDIIRTSDRPKLHWHRSGWTAISLTGARLRRAGIAFAPLPDLRAAQIASIIVERPWAFPSEAPRKGDQFFVVPSWPMHLGVEVYAYFVPHGTSLNVVRSTLPAVGLIDGDTERTVVDLRGRGVEAILVFRFRASDDNAGAAAISVVAGPLRRKPRRSTRYVALWSGTTDNPKVTVDEPPPVGAFLGEGRSLGPA
ncbi:hypothetical protein [Cellulomonas edaphi]|uniref:Uncharacterized protein n=1 Tax=Cellulomonas edaphi TaxID=3053468 RepID=A0ABT7S2M8_9CELL|nr:hypothetical protein [Cellulomons edaphi]MDM7829878.1 hypothetical protein [Cellulomons edaphi]